MKFPCARIAASISGIAAVAQIDLLLHAHTADTDCQGHGKQAEQPCTDEKHGHPTVSPSICPALYGHIAMGRKEDQTVGAAVW